MTDGTTTSADTTDEGTIASARKSASHALESTRDRARQTAEQAGEHPLALLAGGVALGVLVGVLVPRHPRERELLAPVGRRLAEGATAAAAAAKEAGKAELDQLLPDPGKARERVSHVVESAVGAAKNATAA